CCDVSPSAAAAASISPPARTCSLFGSVVDVVPSDAPESEGTPTTAPITPPTRTDATTTEHDTSTRRGTTICSSQAAPNAALQLPGMIGDGPEINLRQILRARPASPQVLARPCSRG